MSPTAALLRMLPQRSLAARLPTRGAVLRRQCACGQHSAGGGECQSCAHRRQMAARLPSGPGGEGLAPPIVYDVLRSPGQALAQGARQFLEPRFGQDFSGVRVHAGSRAAEAARAVSARAFTVGQSIVLGQGHSPASAGGMQLVAHELAHTVQQPNAPAAGEPIEIGRADHPAEREASQLSRAALQGELDGASQASTADSAIQLRRDDTDKPAPPPLIPAPKPIQPLIDSFDPTLTTPLGSGSLEDAHKAWDKLRGMGGSNAGAGGGDCRGMQGFKPGSGSYKGRCCSGTYQSATNCCPPSRMSVADQRCCAPGEVLRGIHCVKQEQSQPQPAPPPAKTEETPLPKLPLPPKPPMQDAPERILPPGQAYA